MTNSFQLNRTWISLGIPFLILLTLLLLSKSTFLNDNPSVGSFAITFDLLFTAPLVYYFLIRKSKIPVTTVVPIILVGLIAGTYILPKENQFYLNLFKIWGLPIVELLVFSFVITRVRHSLTSYKEKKQVNSDFYTALKETCSELIPHRLVPFFATEIAVIYYGFLNWKKRSPKPSEFTYHKNSGITSLIIAIICIALIETFALHILIAKWSNLIAWILSALSIYTVVQLFGFLKSLSQRPILIHNDNLIIRYGILAETEIKLQDIDFIELSTSDLKADKQTKKLSAFGELESHNTIIKLKNEYSLIGLYGIRKKFTNLALFLDDKIEFKNRIEEILQQRTEKNSSQ